MANAANDLVKVLGEKDENTVSEITSAVTGDTGYATMGQIKEQEESVDFY